MSFFICSFVPNAYFAENAKIQGGPVKNEMYNEKSDKTSSLGTEDMNHSSFNEQLSSTIDPAPPLDTNTRRTEHFEDTNLHMDEMGDTIIADLNIMDANPSVFGNSLQNIQSNYSTDVQVDMDNTDDTIIAELDNQVKANMDKNATLTDDIKKLEFARHVDQKLTKNISQLNFLGKIIGTAICQGVFINLNLCKPLVKQVRILSRIQVSLLLHNHFFSMAHVN